MSLDERRERTEERTEAEAAKAARESAEKLRVVEPDEFVGARRDQWTPVSHTWTDRQGRSRTQLFGVPTFRRTATGWERLSGEVSTATGRRFPLAASDSAVPVAFGAGGDQLLRLELPRGRVGMSLVGAESLDPTRVAAPRQQGRIRYRNVMPGVDVTYDVAKAGVKETLLLKSAASPRSFTFRISDPEHLLGTPVANPDESYSFTGAVGDGLAMSLAAPVAWSLAAAAAPPTSADTASAETSASDDQQVPSAHQEVIRTNAGYEIRLSVDPEWVKSQKFPIALDPSITYSWTDGTLASAWADTQHWVSEDYPPLWSHADGSMHATRGGEYEDPAGYVHFDLSNIYEVQSVDTATFELGYQEDVDDCTVRPGTAPGLVPFDAALEDGDSWGDTDLPREFYSSEDPETHEVTVTEVGIDLDAVWEDHIGFGAADGVTASGFERHVADVTAPVQDWIANGTGDQASFMLLVDDAENRFPCTRHSGLPYMYWFRGGYFFDPVLTLTGPQPFPTPIPVEQTYGCDCVYGHGASPTQGDPVSLASGHAMETTTDLEAPSPGVGVSLTRTYNGLDGVDGPLGVGWSYQYGASLTEDALTGDITFRDPTGGRSPFTLQPGGTYLPGPSVTSQLEAVTGGGWRLTSLSGEVLTFDGDGRLVADEDTLGRGLALGYTGSGAAAQLTTITDEVGGETSLTYGTTGDVDGKLISVTTDDGRSVSYDYDTVAGGVRLVGFTDASDVSTEYEYDSTTGRLNGITVEGEGTNAQNVYDPTTGRIVEQTDAAGGVWLFDWVPDADPNAPEGTGVQTTTNPNGDTTQDAFYGNVLIERVDEDGGTTTYYYDQSNNLTAISDPRGFVTAMTYDARGNVLTKTQDLPDGPTESWTYDSANRVTSHTDATEATTTYTYNSQGQLTSSTDPLGNTTTYTYNSLGLLEDSTTPEGRTTHRVYDTDGNLLSETTPGGATTTYTCDDAGNMLTEVDPRGNEPGATAADYTTTYTYDDIGRMVTTTDPHGTTTHSSYNPTGTTDTLTVTDADDDVLKSISYTYDALNRMLTTVEDGRTTLTNTYDPMGNVLTTTDAAGAVTTYTYTPTGRVDTLLRPNDYNPDPDPDPEEYDPSWFLWHYQYDANGNLTRTTDPNGEVEGTVYDALNRPVQNYYAYDYWDEGQGYSITTFGYDAAGRKTSQTDPLSRVTTWSYDDAGRLTSAFQPGQDPTTYTYDDDGNRLTATSPSGTRTTSWTYTDDGQVETKVDPAGNVSGADPEDHTTTVGYDVAGNRTLVTDQLGHQTSSTYDALNQKTSQTDPRGNTTTWAYDALGRMISTTTPGVDGGTTTYAYDGFGDMVTRTDPRGKETTYAYDVRHQVTSVTDPLDRTTSFTYDPNGNQVTTTLPQGNQSGADPEEWTLHTYYDIHDRRTWTGSPDGSGTGLGYDYAGRVTHTSKWAELDQEEVWTFLYRGPAGHIVFADTNTDRLIDPENWEWETVASAEYSYTYTEAGAVETRTYPDNTTVEYDYNADGQPVSVSTGAQTTEFDYDANGQLASLTYPASVGLVQERSYDTAGQLASIDTREPTATDPTSRVDYTRDANGNPTQISRTRGTTTTTEADTYDPQNRLTTHCPGASSCTGATSYVAYTYDESGNRTQQDRVGVTDPGTTTYSYDDADQLTSSTLTNTGGATTSTYTYDAQGHLTSDDRVWDLFGQMVASDVNGPATYQYDGFGNRTTVTSGGTTTTLNWDINNPLAMLTGVTTDDGSTTESQTYIYNPDGSLLEVDHPDQTYDATYAVTDALGSVTDTFADDGTPTTTTDYEPFGDIAASTPLVTNPADINAGYTGAYLEPATGDYDLRARDYNTTTGRFNATDPAGWTDQGAYVSTYAYVNNNPLLYADPSGLCPRYAPACHIGEAVGHAIDEVKDEVVEPIVEQAAEIAHPVLDMGGLVPFAGEWADGVNALIYLYERDYKNFALSCAGMIPGLGWGATGIKHGDEVIGAADNIHDADNAMDATTPAIGFTDDAVGSAYEGMRSGGGHAIRHLRDAGLIENSGSLASQVAKFEELTTPILRSPAMTFDWTIGKTAARGFAGTAGGRQVVVFVAKEGPYQGRVLSAVVPRGNQASMWGLP